jgi:hypothetical protein
MRCSENMRRWQFFMDVILIPCIDIVCSRISSTNFWLCTIGFINETIYSHGRVMISNLLNRLVHEFLVLAPVTAFFSKVGVRIFAVR